MAEFLVNITSYILIFLYFIFFILSTNKDGVKFVNLKLALPYLLVIHAALILIRWLMSGHPPILGVFEATLASSFTLMLFAVAFSRSKIVYKFMSLYAVMILIYGLFFDKLVRPAIPTEVGYLIYIHVVFSWTAYGFLTLNFLSSLGRFYSHNSEGRFGFLKIIFNDKKETEEVVSSYGYNFAFYGFVAMAFMFVFGSLYAAELYLNWWMWDPVYYLMLLSWALYAIGIHGCKFFNWDDLKVAKIFIVSYFSLILLYWILPYIAFATFHIFDLAIKSHNYKIY